MTPFANGNGALELLKDIGIFTGIRREDPSYCLKWKNNVLQSFAICGIPLIIHLMFCFFFG